MNNNDFDENYKKSKMMINFTYILVTILIGISSCIESFIPTVLGLVALIWNRYEVKKAKKYGIECVTEGAESKRKHGGIWANKKKIIKTFCKSSFVIFIIFNIGVFPDNFTLENMYISVFGGIALGAIYTEFSYKFLYKKENIKENKSIKKKMLIGILAGVIGVIGVIGIVGCGGKKKEIAGFKDFSEDWSYDLKMKDGEKVEIISNEAKLSGLTGEEIISSVILYDEKTDVKIIELEAIFLNMKEKKPNLRKINFFENGDIDERNKEKLIKAVDNCYYNILENGVIITDEAKMDEKGVMKLFEEMFMVLFDEVVKWEVEDASDKDIVADKLTDIEKESITRPFNEEYEESTWSCLGTPISYVFLNDELFTSVDDAAGVIIIKPLMGDGTIATIDINENNDLVRVEGHGTLCSSSFLDVREQLDSGTVMLVKSNGDVISLDGNQNLSNILDVIASIISNNY